MLARGKRTTLIQIVKIIIPTPDPNKQADKDNYDSAGNLVPIGTVVGGDDMQPSTVEPLTDPTSTLLDKVDLI